MGFVVIEVMNNHRETQARFPAKVETDYEVGVVLGRAGVTFAEG